MLAKKYEGEKFPDWGIGACCYGTPENPGCPCPKTGKMRIYSGWFISFPWFTGHFLWTDYAGIRLIPDWREQGY